MEYSTEKKQSVLIVDDSEINRCILHDILCDKFDVLEAENGKEAIEIVHQHKNDLSIILLDILMPVMDGFEVLAALNKYGYIEYIPVIMISAESSDSYVERAYALGATDFINKPFEPNIVRQRIINTIVLFNKQQSLMGIVVDQVYEQQQTQALMVGILSHIVETKNGESGLHTLHISTMTRILLEDLVKKTDQYPLTSKDIDVISIAASLHDIGKMQIPDEIINKPGRFTDEEYAIMKTHAALGAEMLKELDDCSNEPLMKYAYDICRWHHERYDGRGYPDGLKGDEIPIWAQVVSVADVYDALTAERVYKKPYDADTAIRMIFNGECGSFNPLLLDCLVACQETIKRELTVKSHKRDDVLHKIANEVLQSHSTGLSQKTFNMYHLEKTKNEFYTNLSDGLHFEFSPDNGELLVLENVRLQQAERVIKNAMQSRELMSRLGESMLSKIISNMRSATPQTASYSVSGPFKHSDGRLTHCVIECLVVFDDDTRVALIGKLTDFAEER